MARVRVFAFARSVCFFFFSSALYGHSSFCELPCRLSTIYTTLAPGEDDPDWEFKATLKMLGLKSEKGLKHGAERALLMERGGPSRWFDENKQR